MSGNNFTCRDKYYNYGSYLRSRGYDKEICALVTDIENGNIPIGPITPGSCSVPTTIDGSLTIKKCTDGSAGILKINGGDILASTSIAPLTDAQDYGLQVLSGSFLQGPIFQTTDCSHNNYYSAANHIFNDPSVGAVCSTNVIIHGDLSANTIIGDISNSQITDLSNAVYNLSNTVVDISNIIQSYSTSFSTQDLSANTLQVDSSVNFTQNPVITNGAASYSSRVLQNYGQSTAILQLDASGSYSAGSYDISFNTTPVYSDMDASATTFNDENYINFSSNQPYFEDSIMEMYVNAKLQFDNSANSISFLLNEHLGPDKILLDTRSIGEKNVDKSLSFGPKMFIFKSSVPTDYSYLSHKWKIGIDISGGSVTFSEHPRLIIKQKSIV